MSQKAKMEGARIRIGRVLIILISLFAAEAQARYRYSYVCPAYAGGFFIGDGTIGLQLFDERSSIGEMSGRRHLVLDRFKYVECREDDFFCISGVGASKFFADIPIAVPKVIDGISKYKYAGLTLEAAPVERERYKGRKAAQLVVQSPGDNGGSWYSLTVVEGVGVVDFYIPRVLATKSATGDLIELKGLTCYLDSEKGIFSRVKIRSTSSKTFF
jgi:hypothetical protein